MNNKHTILFCPYCFEKKAYFHENYKGKERYRCRDCNKSFIAVGEKRLVDFKSAKKSMDKTVSELNTSLFELKGKKENILKKIEKWKTLGYI